MLCGRCSTSSRRSCRLGARMRASGASLHVPDLRCYVGSLVSVVSQFRCFYALLLFDFYVYASSSSSSSVLALCAACSTEAAPTSVPRLDFCGLVSGLHFALVYHLRSCASSRPHLIPPPCYGTSADLFAPKPLQSSQGRSQNFQKTSRLNDPASCQRAVS